MVRLVPAPGQQAEEMTVTEFNPVKGFGWARSADHSRVFLHKSDFLDAKFKPLQGDVIAGKLTFFPKDDEKRSRALEITLETEASDDDDDDNSSELKDLNVGDTYKGNVKAIDAEKGFGFITVDGYKDVFRKPGTSVEFIVVQSKKKANAIQAKVNNDKVDNKIVKQGKKAHLRE
eukprot:gene6766-1313_t